MGRNRKRTKGNGIPGPFTPLLHSELDSGAFRALTGNSVKAFLLFKRLHNQLVHKTGDRDPIFSFPYSRAKKAGISESTFRRAIRELWAKGFVSVISIGGLRGAGRTNSQYKLAGYWKTYGEQWEDRKLIEPDPFTICEPN